MPGDDGHDGFPSKCMIALSMSTSFSPLNGVIPVNNSKKMHPVDHISTSAPYLTLPRSSSGALHNQHPYSTVNQLEHRHDCTYDLARHPTEDLLYLNHNVHILYVRSSCSDLYLASPKSASFNAPSELTSILLGLMSRCKTFLLWQNASACSIWLISAFVKEGGEPPQSVCFSLSWSPDMSCSTYSKTR